MVKNIHLLMQKTQEMPVPPLGQEDPLEKEMATHFCFLAWEIPWTEEPGGLQSWDCTVGRDLASVHAHTLTSRLKAQIDLKPG